MIRRVLAVSLALFVCGFWAPADSSAQAPLEIGHEPQFVFDLHVVDNHFAIKYKRRAVKRVFHQPRKHEANPLIAKDGGYVNVLRDEQTGQFHMWYQKGYPQAGSDRNLVSVAYARSSDGVDWERPDLEPASWPSVAETQPQNIVLAWPDMPKASFSGAQVFEAPAADRRGYRYLMLYRIKGPVARENRGLHLIGSHDGVHWDRDSNQRIAHLHSDTLNTVVHDPERDRYVIFCRPKDRYRHRSGDMIDTGASRRVARMVSDTLWTDWDAEPQMVLIPDEADNETHHNFFYGMPTHYHGGIYWGFLWPFRMNTVIHTELAFSRDGRRFERLPQRPRLVELGEEGEWDSHMIFAGPRWLEVGDEWWFYYAGWDGPHKTPPGETRHPGIGLATVRKEGLVSLHGPADGGGVVVTRTLEWPGGDLSVNADAAASDDSRLSVRVSTPGREPIDRFDYKDCDAFTGDDTAHVLRWGGRSLDELAGETIRLEFFLQDAHLYTFRATESAQ